MPRGIIRRKASKAKKREPITTTTMVMKIYLLIDFGTGGANIILTNAITNASHGVAFTLKFLFKYNFNTNLNY